MLEKLRIEGWRERAKEGIGTAIHPEYLLELLAAYDVAEAAARLEWNGRFPGDSSHWDRAYWNCDKALRRYELVKLGQEIPCR